MWWVAAGLMLTGVAYTALIFAQSTPDVDACVYDVDGDIVHMIIDSSLDGRHTLSGHVRGVDSSGRLVLDPDGIVAGSREPLWTAYSTGVAVKSSSAAFPVAPMRHQVRRHRAYGPRLYSLPSGNFTFGVNQ